MTHGPPGKTREIRAVDANERTAEVCDVPAHDQLPA
jgi:hypothetical protein